METALAQHQIKDSLTPPTPYLPTFDECCPSFEDIVSVGAEEGVTPKQNILQCQKIDPKKLEGAALPSAFKQNKKQGGLPLNLKYMTNVRVLQSVEKAHARLY